MSVIERLIPAKETLTVGMELAYPPFETKDEAGNPTGMSADFMKDFGDYIGKDIQIEQKRGETSFAPFVYCFLEELINQ